MPYACMSIRSSKSEQLLHSLRDLQYRLQKHSLYSLTAKWDDLFESLFCFTRTEEFSICCISVGDNRK